MGTWHACVYIYVYAGVMTPKGVKVWSLTLTLTSELYIQIYTRHQAQHFLPRARGLPAGEPGEGDGGRRGQ